MPEIPSEFLLLYQI